MINKELKELTEEINDQFLLSSLFENKTTLGKMWYNRQRMKTKREEHHLKTWSLSI
ncbi:MAG: hypothetical protein IMW92_04200 [Bacillales bacterium]|nr:hypothetical protein [Bacillales bacterium]